MKLINWLSNKFTNLITQARRNSYLSIFFAERKKPNSRRKPK